MCRAFIRRGRDAVAVVPVKQTKKNVEKAGGKETDDGSE